MMLWVCNSGFLVLLEPGGDEPETHHHATRLYTGMHAMSVQRGTYRVTVTVGADGADALTLRHVDAPDAVPSMSVTHKPFAVSGGRFVVADANAFSPAQREAFLKGHALPPSAGLVVIDGWKRRRSEVVMDARAPDTRCIWVGPPSRPN